MNKKVFVGVDGCSAGWFAVFLAEPDADECDRESCNSEKCSWEPGVFPYFSALWDFLKTSYEDYEPLVLIDIPIGLKAGGTGERLSDLGARKILKARKSSIFPVPCREAVYAETYGQACEINEKLTGKRISKQTWNILPKIRDVDSFLLSGPGSWSKGKCDGKGKCVGAAVRDLIWETGPEICFQAFAGQPMKYSKKKEEGFLERKEVLKNIEKILKKIGLSADETFKDKVLVDEILETALSRYRRKDVARDDIQDALVAAFTAKIGHRYGFEYIPTDPEKDAEGLRIQLVYCNYFEKVVGSGA
jgi:predicted RNase H-like nuclease